MVLESDQVDPLHYLAQLQMDHHQNPPVDLPDRLLGRVRVRPAAVHGRGSFGSRLTKNDANPHTHTHILTYLTPVQSVPTNERNNLRSFLATLGFIITILAVMRFVKSYHKHTYRALSLYRIEKDDIIIQYEQLYSDYIIVNPVLFYKFRLKYT